MNNTWPEESERQKKKYLQRVLICESQCMMIVIDCEDDLLNFFFFLNENDRVDGLHPLFKSSSKVLLRSWQVDASASR